MMLLQNKLLLPKSGEPRQEGKTGLLEAGVLTGLPEVGILPEVKTPSGVPKVVIVTGPPPTPLPLRMWKSLPIQSGRIAVPGKRKNQTIR
jgi:hypothetical protein